MSATATRAREPAARYDSWNRVPAPAHRHVAVLRRELLPGQLDGLPRPLLAYGRGRSYGDTCACPGGTLLDTGQLTRILDADWETGVIRVEAGVTLEDLLTEAVPRGWFPAVTPGTRLVTIGGAIAHDVHGKNHHRRGTFGCHVERIALLRSDGRLVECSTVDNSGLFAATVGGLGLTGLILWAEIRLMPIPGPYIELEQFRVRNLGEALDAAEASSEWEYTVAWLDVLAPEHMLGRGVHMRGRHAAAPLGRPPRRPRVIAVPFDMPSGMINRGSIGIHNRFRYLAAPHAPVRSCSHYESFFYPLDGLGGWNRLYGRRGFFQHQSLIPTVAAAEGVRDLLRCTRRSRETPALAVLKDFGDSASPGLLSFPRPGFTLALDFPNRGSSTLQLLRELDAIVRAVGGTTYPAKDARMAPADFRAFFPQWRSQMPWIDPSFRSGFWQRVTAAGPE